jgi:hypothetical protein
LKALSYSCSQQKRQAWADGNVYKLHQIILQLGIWKDSSFDLVIFDLSHVNEALIQHKSKPVHGIIGADVLLKEKRLWTITIITYICLNKIILNRNKKAHRVTDALFKLLQTLLNLFFHDFRS